MDEFIEFANMGFIALLGAQERMIDMKFENISIGDQVFHDDQVVEITAAVSKNQIFAKNYEHCYSADELNEIKLTDEILEKNFTRSKDRVFESTFDISTMWRIWPNANYGYILATLATDEFGGGFYVPCIPCLTVSKLNLFLKLLEIDKKIEL